LAGLDRSSAISSASAPHPSADQRRGRLKGLLSNWSEKDVQFIVVIGGERTLGMGDLG